MNVAKERVRVLETVGRASVLAGLGSDSEPARPGLETAGRAYETAGRILELRGPQNQLRGPQN